MTRSKTKKSISRENLETHGIYYDDKDFGPPSLLPDYVDAVRQVLLSFTGIVPSRGWPETLQEEVDTGWSKDVPPQATLPPASSLVSLQKWELDSGRTNPTWDLAFQNMEDCAMVSKEARELVADAEDGWKQFWRSNLFTIVSDKARRQPGFHPILDNWSLEGDCEWTEFDNFRPNGGHGAPRTHPKPDLTYAFPVRTAPSDHLRGIERDEYVRSLHLQSLQTLSERDIICTPTTGVRMSTKASYKKSLKKTDLACFPWAVVEFKRHARGPLDKSFERCYCQAANASAAALELREQVLERSCILSYADFAPVVSFTCVGPMVKVWLTYLLEPDDQGIRRKRMVCIWTTSACLTWGVASLRAITSNMHAWASRLLKPKIQTLVLQILNQAPVSLAQPETPRAGISLAGIFSSPRLVTTGFTRPRDSNVHSPAMDATPCRPCGSLRSCNLSYTGPGSLMSRGKLTDELSHIDVSSTPLRDSQSSRIGDQGASIIFPTGRPQHSEDRSILSLYLPSSQHDNRQSGATIDEITDSLDAYHIDPVTGHFPTGAASRSFEAAVDPDAVQHSYESSVDGTDRPLVGHGNLSPPLEGSTIETTQRKDTSTIWSKLAGSDLHTEDQDPRMDDGQSSAGSNALRPPNSGFKFTPQSIEQSCSSKLPLFSSYFLSSTPRVKFDFTSSLVPTASAISTISTSGKVTVNSKFGIFHLSGQSYPDPSCSKQPPLGSATEAVEHETVEGQDAHPPGSDINAAVPPPQVVQNKQLGCTASLSSTSVFALGMEGTSNTVLSFSEQTRHLFATKLQYRSPQIQVAKDFQKSDVRDTILNNTTNRTVPLSVTFEKSSQQHFGCTTPSEEDSCMPLPKQAHIVDVTEVTAVCRLAKKASTGQSNIPKPTIQHTGLSSGLFSSMRRDTQSLLSPSVASLSSDGYDADEASAGGEDLSDDNKTGDSDRYETYDSSDDESIHNDDSTSAKIAGGTGVDYDNSSTNSESEDHEESDENPNVKDSESESEDHEESDENPNADDGESEDHEESDEDPNADDGEEDCHDNDLEVNCVDGDSELSEDENCWAFGLGSLDGYRLSELHHLRVIFMKRSPREQCHMIQEVIGTGRRDCDTYERDGQNLLWEFLERLDPKWWLHIHGHFMQEINVPDFLIKGKLTSAIRHLLKSSTLDRWHCFRFALGIRSRYVCSEILLSKPFNFTEREWMALDKELWGG